MFNFIYLFFFIVIYYLFLLLLLVSEKAFTCTAIVYRLRIHTDLLTCLPRQI